MTIAKETHAFTGVATGDWIAIRGWFNVHVVDDGSFDGVVQLQKRYLDDANTVYAVEAWVEGDLPVSKRGFETEAKVEYRLACTVRNAGGASGRISQ